MRTLLRMPRSRRTRDEIPRKDVGSEEKWYGKSSHSPKGEWDSTANGMVQRFKKAGHPVFKCISAFSRGILKQKNGLCTGVNNLA